VTTTAEKMIAPLSRCLDSLESGDVDGFMAIIEEISDPDCEWSPFISGEVEGRTFRGIDGMREWASDLVETFEIRYTDRRLETAGDDAVLLLSRFVYRGRGSGAETNHEVGVLWEYQDGLFRRGQAWGSYDEALAAAEALSHA
jgi:ketosteroid isomerase-like protein